MANIRQRAENGTGSIRWIDDRECECIIQSQYINPKTGKSKRFKRKLKIDSSQKVTRKLQQEIENQVRQNTIYLRVTTPKLTNQKLLGIT